MKKKIGILLCIVMLITMIFSMTGCSSISNDYCRITEMDYKAVVVDEPDSEGKIVVTERITFDVHAASKSNPFWELWRDLCEDWVDGVQVHYKVNSVKQILPDGTAVEWPESPELYWDDYDYVKENTRLGPGKWYHSEGPYSEYLEQYECVFFYVDGLYREKVTFEIEYEMYNAVLRYNDCSDLYIAMYSGDTTRYLEKFNAQILIPEKDMPREGNYKATTYGTNAGSFPIEESKTKNPGYHTFSFSLTEDDLKFKSWNEYIEFDLVSYGEDKHIFAENASQNYYSNDDVLDEVWEEQEYYVNAPARYNKMKTTVFVVCLIIATLVLLLSISKIVRLKRKYSSDKSVDKNTTFRDIPSDLDPKFANALVFCRDKKPEYDSGVYSSILLSLARKKYIDIVETSYSDAMIIVNEDFLPKTTPVIPERPENPYANTYCNEYGYNGVDDDIDIQHREHENVRILNGEPESSRKPRVYDEIGFMNETQATEQSYGQGERQSRTYSSFNDSAILPPSYESERSYNYESSYEPNYNQNICAENTIEETDSVVPKEPLEPLTVNEEHYFKLILRHTRDGNIRMSTFQNRVATDYDYTRSFARNVKKSVIDIGIGQGYFQKANWLAPQQELASSSTIMLVFGVIIALANFIIYQTPLELAFGGPLLLATTFIIMGLYQKSQSHKFALLTQFGEQEYVKWRGLYNFLKSDTLLKERTIVELPLWEKYLVYATAFGISEKVISAIKIRCPEIMGSTSIVHNSYCRSGRIRTSGRRFHSSIRSGSFSGCGGGGSFGYGGGGRGGGGGGGGH